MMILNFSLNKFLPFIILTCLSFHSLGFERFEPYIIIALAIFIGHFNFKAGYAVAYCEKNNIDLNVE